MRVLAYSAGVQSTTALVLSVLGKNGVPPIQCAIFADTGDEPAWVYETLRFYSAWAAERGVPVLTVSRGRISDDMKKTKEEGRRWASIPAFTAGPKGAAPLRRQCTREYKIDVIEKLIRKQLGLRKYQKCRTTVELILGISLDESQRARPNRKPWLRNIFPLIDAGLTRRDCIQALIALGLPFPKKSACVFCPYHSDRFWRDLKVNYPQEWKRVVEADQLVRNMTKAGVERPAFLHRSLKPINEIDFEAQQELFPILDCDEGYCGL